MGMGDTFRGPLQSAHVEGNDVLNLLEAHTSESSAVIVHASIIIAKEKLHGEKAPSGRTPLSQIIILGITVLPSLL